MRVTDLSEHQKSAAGQKTSFGRILCVTCMMYGGVPYDHDCPLIPAIEKQTGERRAKATAAAKQQDREREIRRRLDHQHAWRQIGSYYGFSICVVMCHARPNHTQCGHDCDPVAHGGITYRERCSCGAERAVNANAGHVEVGHVDVYQKL